MKRANRATYKIAQQETAQLILAVVDNTWVRELRNTKTLYTNIAPKVLLSNLQAGCTGRHALNLLALHNKMQRYHLEVEGIPEYINMLEDVKKQAGQAGQTISDERILIFASTKMLTTKRFPLTNYNCDNCAESNKRWADWKVV